MLLFRNLTMCAAASSVFAVASTLRGDATDEHDRYERLLQAAAGSSTLRCSVDNAAGTGLQVDYHASPTLQGEPLASRRAAAVHVDAEVPEPGHPPLAQAVAARWHGWLKVPITGRYAFHGGPGSQVHVGGLAMHGVGAPLQAGLELQAGRYYPIEVQADLRVPGSARLEWTVPHGMRYVIPTALLFPPTGG